MGNNPTYKRNQVQREKDLLFIAEKSLKGYSQSFIAAELGVSQVQIHKDLKKIRNEWRDERLEFADDLVNIELKKCDLIEREAWQAWDRSCAEAKRRTIKAIGKSVDDQKDKPSSVEQTTSTEQRDGDAQHLHTILQSMNRRAKLLGLDRPQKVEQSGAISIKPQLDSESILAEIKQIEAELATQEKRTARTTKNSKSA